MESVTDPAPPTDPVRPSTAGSTPDIGPAKQTDPLAAGRSGRAGTNPLQRIPLARRWRVSWLVGAVVVVLVYVLVAVAYTTDSRAVDAAYASSRVDSAQVIVTLTPMALDAATPRLTLQVEVEVADPALLTVSGALTRDLEVEVLPAGGTALTFSAGRVPDSRTVSVPMVGDIESWPFDDYDADVLVDAQIPATDPAVVQAPVVAVRTGGLVQGWTGTAGSTDILGPANPADAVHLHFSRALAIKLFAGVLILVMVLMPILLLAVAVPLYREQRLFEAGFLGYAAAMLFATVPLRNFFPGNPPAGSWVDVLVVLWVLVALIVGIGVTVLAFLRHPRGR